MHTRLLVLVFLAGTTFAQNWSGVLDPKRATDWSKAGIQGSHPSDSLTQCVTAACNTVGTTVTLANINAAITSAPCGTYIKLPFVAVSLGGSVLINKSCVELRGTISGNDMTKLTFTSITSPGFGWFMGGAIAVGVGSFNIGCTTGCGGGPGPDNTAAVTGTAGTAPGGSTGANLYPQGATIVTLSSTTGLVARSGSTPGTTLFIDQVNDSSDGFPAAGDLFVCNGAAPCSGEGAGATAARTSGGVRSQVELHEVTAINGSQITIDPPLIAANIRSSQSPGAWWASSTHQLNKVGIRDLTIDFSATGSFAAGIYAVNVSNFWAKGVRIIYNSPATSFVHHIYLLNSFRSTIQNSYFYGANASASQNTNYTITQLIGSSDLIENNILHHNVIPYAPDDPTIGNVIAYNYVDDAYYPASGFQPHQSGDLYNLFEANNMGTFFSDNIHGTHFFNTLYRNHFDAHNHNPGGVTADGGIVLWGRNRFFNLLGNVFGASQYTQYQLLLADSGNTVYQLGDKGNCSNCGALADDSNVNRTLMRWGNWDNVTSTNDTGTNDSTGTRFVGSEVPRGITNFPNAVPASQSLPASLYLADRPSAWWKVGSTIPAWPPIGPDVSGGDAPNTATYPTGGHAYKIPARLAFESLTNDPAYPTSSPRIKLFTASVYQDAGATAAPSVNLNPTSLTFAGTKVYSSAPTQGITLTNTGTATLTLSSISITGTNSADYSQSNNCGSSVAASASCTITVTFTPQNLGSRSASVTISDNASGSPHAVSLSGTGTDPVIYRPTTQTDLGDSAFGNPAFAYDGDFSSSAIGLADDTNAIDIIFHGFKAIVGTPTDVSLYVKSAVSFSGSGAKGAVCSYSLNGGTQFANIWSAAGVSPANRSAIDRVALPKGQDLTQVRVECSGSCANPGCSVALSDTEIFVQTTDQRALFQGTFAGTVQ